MTRKFIAFAAMTLSTSAVADTTIVVQYPYGELFDGLHKQLAQDFEQAHPDIKVKFRSNYENYEDATQKVMREAITNQLPDVSFQGLNRVLPLYERNIAVPLDQFITEEDRTQNGYDDSMMSPSKFDGQTYGLPFAVSMPIVYFNADLVKQATGEPTLPSSWADIYSVAAKINELEGNPKGMYYDWNITGNWLWLSLVMSQGGDILRDGKVAFDGEEGQWAINQLAQMHTKADMPDYQRRSAERSFGAGNIGIYVTSTSNLAMFERSIGDKFELKTVQFPEVRDGGTLPVGGNAVVMLSKDKKQQEAAWKYIKYITGPEGNQQIPHFTGYMPPNQIAAQSLDAFYQERPNHKTAVSSLPLMDTWVSFPGANGLKITDVISDELHTVVSGARAQGDEPKAVLEEMSNKVNQLLN
ncbi:ABC transporter substrate-binding protein [Vibrio sp. D404a]|uniref:ABC transporter substrate-binding protein n=1 Tax=unclassified Vibrio TaxID=2614977 RepID=UPI002553EAAD|nr:MULTISPECIES: ABC transporter substrate-binding protein [unclassified Vibrio]MDK9739489.1 ABC transporter substrate-binding protein [Vibrio sp. D404a]MDK9798969.1 ABC transporter substrate-binding protein [Vibrio sp. D449a]